MFNHFKKCETWKKEQKKCCESTKEGQEEQSRADDPSVDMANGLVASLSRIMLDENIVKQRTPCAWNIFNENIKSRLDVTFMVSVSAYCALIEFG